MLMDVVSVTVLGATRLRLRFEDGAEGEVDVADMVPFDGVFEPLADPAEFAKVRVDPELGAIVWPGGADLAPDALYSRIAGTPLAGRE
jgi:hypothetical protein